MPKSHRPYPPEFRRQMVDLVRSGPTPEALSREFEPTAQAIWNWCDRPIAMKAAVRTAVFSYIEGWYNPAHRHSGIRYLSPVAYDVQILKETQTT